MRICASGTLLVLGLTSSPRWSSAQDNASAQADTQNLIIKLRSDDDEVRQDAAAALAKLGAPAVQPLLEILDNEQGYARVYVARVLLDNDRNNQRALATLIEVAKSKKESLEVRRYACYALALIAPNGVKTLIQMLKDPDTFVRRSAVFALEELLESRAYLSLDFFVLLKASIPVLLEATSDSDQIVKGVAVEALTQLPEELEEIQGMAKQNGNKELQKVVKMVLETRKKSSHAAGLGYDLEFKPGYEDALTKRGNFFQGTLGIIHAIGIGGGPVKDFRSIPGKFESDVTLHVVVNPRTRKAWTGVNRFNPYVDLK